MIIKSDTPVSSQFSKSLNIIASVAMKMYAAMEYNTTMTFIFKGNKIILLNKKDTPKTSDGVLVVTKSANHFTVNVENPQAQGVKNDKKTGTENTIDGGRGKEKKGEDGKTQS